MRRLFLFSVALSLLIVPTVVAQVSSVDGPDDKGSGISQNPMPPFRGTCPVLNYCYYELGFGQGNPSQVAPILTAGHTPVDVVTPDAAGLAGCDALFANNSSNGDYDAEWVANLADIDAAVQAGMALVFHDRFVTDAATNIPGLGATTCTRDFGDDADIDVVDNTTSVTNGPGGLVDNTTLDGGTSSSHGFCDDATLPPDSPLNILSNSTPTRSVTYSYRHGIGSVVYSTIPLDFYLGGGDPDFDLIYAPNVVQYGADLFCANVPVELMSFDIE